MGSRVDAHRDRVRVLTGDALVHLEQVGVALHHHVASQPPDRVAEVQIDAAPPRADAATLVAHFLGASRCDVTRGEVAEARVQPLQVVVALRLRDLLRPPLVAGPARDPDPAVVAQRLAHQRELRLVLARGRDAGRMDLGEAGVRERGAALVGAPDGGDVAALRVGRQIKDVGVAARGEDDRVGGVGADLPGHEVACDDAARPPVDHDQVEHLVTRVHLHRAPAYLPGQRLVRAEQELLAGLAAGVERARDLHAAERAVGEQPAVLPRERNALRHALVDDAGADLGQTVYIRLARAEVAPFDRVVEETKDRVAVVLVVLGRVDTALRCDRVRTPGRVLEAEARNVVAQIGEGGGGRGPGEPRAHHDDVILPLVGRRDEPDLGAVARPLRLERP